MMPMNLPQPNEPFAWVQAGHAAQTLAGPALVCRGLERAAPHLFTTRQWPLGSRVAGAAPFDNVKEWDDVARAMDVDATRLVRLRQVHGAAVVVARDSPAATPDADIVVSNTPDLALAVVAADCVPLLVADRMTGAIAAAHAGWRGLAARVPGASVAALVREFGCRTEDLVAAVGPSIGACCYEVGGDVLQRFVRSGFARDHLERWFLKQPASSGQNPSMPVVAPVPGDGHWFFDGWASARDQLEAVGISPDRVFVAGLCTASHPGCLCSYRRDGPTAGRMAAVIRCPPRRP
jgi:YfiH family protein